ncbi:MATE family efflux transporter [Candidatus Dependentiae bacterium]|nr:MATE family efflux transporter [Candidatus Dependentiae bacterium]
MNYVYALFRDSFKKGDSCKQIIGYWLPEIISATILFSLPAMVDSWIIAQLGSSTIYGALAMGSNFLHSLTKLAEAIPVASMAIIGRHNGAKEYAQCGEGLADSFWTTFLLGLAQFIVIFFSAHAIYRWLNVPADMVSVGAPFLQLKSLGVLLIFTTLGLLGFMRAIKNTHIPMMLNIIGLVSFIFFDYVLVLGKFGFPQLGITGSAVATIIQYGLMNIVAIGYILLNPAYKKYFTKLFFNIFNFMRMGHLVNLSWRIMLDKSIISFAYIWLAKMLAPMGKHAINSFDVVLKLERSAFLPVIAAAQIITFLVSNRLGARDVDGAYANIKKLYLLTCGSLFIATIILLANPTYFVSIFDPNNNFTTFAVTVLPIINIFVFFDFTQVFLAGALRGAGDVKTVMWTRFFVTFFFFVPLSYIFSSIPHISDVLRFVLVYGSFYVATGVMGLVFLYRIKSHAWHKHIV